MAVKKAIRYAMSNRKREAILFFVLMFALPALIVLDRRGGKTLREDYLPQDQRSKDFRKYHNRVFRVIEVVDGDTLYLDEKDGDFGYTRVRLLGIDTPETAGLFSMYYGKEASKAATALAWQMKVVVKLDEVADVRDRYGRLLAYIVLKDLPVLGRRSQADKRILNEVLLQHGFAYADTRFDHSQYEKYILLQEEAKEQRKGLWKEVTFDQLPKWLQRESPNILDNENP